MKLMQRFYISTCLIPYSCIHGLFPSLLYPCPFHCVSLIFILFPFFLSIHSLNRGMGADATFADDKILVQMGSLREGKTPEEKDQYIAGLKEIINEMRRDKVKDFNTVATEIAAYRRRFLQDPSRVLPL